VLWEAARHDENRVEAHIVSGTHEAGRECIGCGGDAAEAELVERVIGFSGGGASLYLDESNNAAPAGNEIDFSHWCTHPPSNDPPALQLEPKPRQPFRSPAAAFGALAFHFSACARS
jgi:hypothetical protein